MGGGAPGRYDRPKRGGAGFCQMVSLKRMSVAGLMWHCKQLTSFGWGVTGVIDFNVFVQPPSAWQVRHSRFIPCASRGWGIRGGDPGYCRRE